MTFVQHERVCEWMNGDYGMFEFLQRIVNIIFRSIVEKLNAYTRDSRLPASVPTLIYIYSLILSYSTSLTKYNSVPH